ncbi:alcohol dehydrogenase catalytic domain-containing protein [Nocardia sp. GAS34]|uniref:alcohol dehydrogenase catalytic domain-containing protein n=1 Tax=unclassified Nocardia TaxID=2637762 RepID=UPI003D227BF2
MLGRYQIKPPAPFTPGVDIAGVVIETGPNCTRFAVGDRVHGLAPLGGFADGRRTSGCRKGVGR